MTKQERRLILAGYALQGLVIPFPILIVISLVWLLYLGRRVKSADAVAHVRWQLRTYGYCLGLFLLALVFMVWLGLDLVSWPTKISLVLMITCYLFRPIYGALWAWHDIPLSHHWARF